MAFSLSNMYSIPEHPAEEDALEDEYTEICFTVGEADIPEGKKRNSSVSLPEKSLKAFTSYDSDNKSCDVLLPSSIVQEKKCNQAEDFTFNQKPTEIKNRISVSLIDFTDLCLVSDSGSSNIDKLFSFANTATPKANVVKNSVSYLEVQDYRLDPDQNLSRESLSLGASSESVSFKKKESHCSGKNNTAAISNRKKTEKRIETDNLIFVDLNSDSEKLQSTTDVPQPDSFRQRSGSFQWIQSAIHNVNLKYHNLRRPSDVVGQDMWGKNEEIEMNEQMYAIPKIAQNPAAGGRRYSENIIGKQKRSPLVSGIGHLRVLWKDKLAGIKKHEEQDVDQNRPDVCPLFNFPNKIDEDEVVLDALRQAMRKCTALDPTSRPNSATVLDQLSHLLD